MSWTLAPSLAQLRKEVNARWPLRSKTADGSIGDAAHSARKSEHNPDAGGVVRAIDITANGIDTTALLNALVGDDRVHYVIYNRRICSRSSGWVWRRYTGANPHTSHIHVSIRNNTSEAASTAARTAAALNTKPWFKTGGFKPITPPTVPAHTNNKPKAEEDMPEYFETRRTFKHGGNGWQVLTDPPALVVDSPMHLIAAAKIHGPEGHRLVTRWAFGHDDHPGFWNNSDMEVVHPSHRTETVHDGWHAWPDEHICLDVYATERGEYTVTITGYYWKV